MMDISKATAEELRAGTLREYDEVFEGAREIETITAEINFFKAVGGQAVIEIGKRLIEAKEALAHGEWLPWLAEEVGFSEASAQRYMRLAREYGNPSPVTDLGASKALILLGLPASEREEFVSKTHEVNGAEKTVSEMSKRELEEAIRQRKLAEAEAKKLTRELEQQKTDMQSAEENAARAQEEAEKARAEVEIARESALAAQERTAALERELKALRERPVDVAVETVDASEGQIAAAVLEAREEAETKHAEAMRKTEKELKRVEKKLAEAKKTAKETESAQKAAVEKAESAEKAARKEAEALRAELERAKKSARVMDNKALAEFGVLFRQAQETVNRLVELLDEVGDENRAKVYRALSALARMIEEQAGEEVKSDG